jgi:hypothetical protein
MTWITKAEQMLCSSYPQYVCSAAAASIRDQTHVQLPQWEEGVHLIEPGWTMQQLLHGLRTL